MKSTPSAKSPHFMGLNTPIKVTSPIRWGKAFPRGWHTHGAASISSIQWNTSDTSLAQPLQPIAMRYWMKGCHWSLEELRSLRLSRSYRDRAKWLWDRLHRLKKNCVQPPDLREQEKLIKMTHWSNITMWAAISLLHTYPYLLTILLMLKL